MLINDVLIARTATWPLAEVIARLSQHPQVEGIMQIVRRMHDTLTAGGATRRQP